ncbi:CAF17-like 4Fe-4S cluster assembly/insertion protein YgfZ [Gluconobacter oxydans]|nr:folate-binding protein [Gluconobacter oxydans]
MTDLPAMVGRFSSRVVLLEAVGTAVSHMHEYLSHRAVLSFTGTDRASFLQGLITNDVQNLTDTTAVWSALLTPQGRWLSEFFLYATPDRILMDCPADHAEMLVKRLSRFRLRADVQIENTPFQVITGAEDHAVPETVLTSAPDPRCEGAGWRAVVTEPAQGGETAPAFLERRLTLGLPDVMDFESEQTLALEADMDLLHGVSWKKGCYMGQELTARTHYRGLVKRRLLPVVLSEGTFPDEGGIIVSGEREVGDIRSRSGNRALAMLRRDAWSASDLTCNGQPLSVVWPVWFPEEMRS